MVQLFISYARENKSDVEALIKDLNALGHQAWMDSSLRGGQTWWTEILRRIAECDVFVASISDQTLNSVACKRELDWALSLNKPVLPIAVGRRPDVLPRALSMRQVIDYSPSARETAFALAGALGNLPAAPPMPDPMPEPPPAPLSYLPDLVDQVTQTEPMSHEQQRQLLVQLEPALRSADAEEYRGGRYVLEMLGRRDDLYSDVDHALSQLRDSGRGEVPSPSTHHASAAPAVAAAPAATAAPAVAAPHQSGAGRSRARLWIAVAGLLAGVAAIAGVLHLVRATPDQGPSSATATSSPPASTATSPPPTPPGATTAPSSPAGGGQLYRGYILPPIAKATGVDVRAQPKLSAALVGNLPVDTDVYIVCVALGDSVEGPGPNATRQNSPVWDLIRTGADEEDLGYVPDAWVNTGGTQARAETCPGR